MNRKQAKDIAVFSLARFVRFILGWYWLPNQKADLIKAEQIAMKAYRSHGRKSSHGDTGTSSA